MEMEHVGPELQGGAQGTPGGGDPEHLRVVEVVEPSLPPPPSPFRVSAEKGVVVVVVAPVAAKEAEGGFRGDGGGVTFRYTDTRSLRVS